ncbi:hypothetical protein IHP14_11015 [Enterococcus faecium]|uniref:hypothetical protein n=1 Tax=Enterococcus faecium TaxID=1352 RepID=UPI0017806A68|nr:hypothetical protein [Enterococcus faecium]MBD9697608.1 hypothetical protein [Enterococcus faecium]
MARPVLEAMDMDTLTKGRYVQLLARGYSPKEVFKRSKTLSNNLKQPLILF